MKCRPMFPNWGNTENFSITLNTDWYCALKVIPFRIYIPGPVPFPLLEASLELPFHDAVQHCLLLSLNLLDILKSFSL
jgi:hypothetical protein